MTDLSLPADAWEGPDGSRIEIRPIRPEDETPLRALYRNLSKERLRPPSFGAADAQPRDCFSKLCRLDSDQDVGFVADRKDAKGASQLLGLCRWFFEPETNSAELGLEVVKAWFGKGLSYRLLKPMIAVARERGVRQLVTGTQNTMLSVATSFGFMMTGKVVGSDATFEVARVLETGIDLRKYDPTSISKADINHLVDSMVKVGWKDEIMDFFRDVDPHHATQCLDELFHGSDPHVRGNALELLVFLKGPASLPWIEECLADADVDSRCAGCRYLADLDCPEVVPRLLRRLREDPSDWVRCAAVEALEICGDMSAIPALEETAKNDKGTDFEGRSIRGMARKAIKRVTARNR